MIFYGDEPEGEDGLNDYDDSYEHNRCQKDGIEEYSCEPLNWKSIGLAMSFADHVARSARVEKEENRVEVCSLRPELREREPRAKGSFDDYIKDIVSGRRSLFECLKKENE